MVRIILRVCQYCQRVGKRAIGYVKEKSCSILKSRAEMVRGREDLLDGGGHPSRGHQQEEHHPHPGVDPSMMEYFAKVLVGNMYVEVEMIKVMVEVE